MDLGGLWGGAKSLGGKALSWGSGAGELKALGLMPETGQPGFSSPEQEILQRNQALLQREQGAYDQQNRLSGLLFQSAQGQGPSYAGLQLGQGLENIQRGAANAAAGAGGNEGVLARYAAINSAANAGAAANQSAALARAQEITQARGLLGTNLGNMAGESGGLYGANLTGLVGLRGGDIEQQKNANATRLKILGSAASAIGSGGAQGIAAGGGTLAA